MGRALHVSRSLPPIISSARIVTSIEKSSCISSVAESALSDCSNGELPLHYRLYPSRGFSPLPARKPVVCPTIISRVCQKSMFARCFSSGSDWSETDDEHGADSGHCRVSCLDKGSHSLPVGCVRAAYETETETDAEAVASPLMKEDHGSRKPGSRFQQEQVWQAPEAETDAEIFASSCDVDEILHHERGTFHLHQEAESGKRVGRSTKREQVWEAAYATETDTDADAVANKSNEDENLHHGRTWNSELHHLTESETDERSQHLSAEGHAAYVTESETDVDAGAGTLNGGKHSRHGRREVGLPHEMDASRKDEYRHQGRQNFWSRHPSTKHELVQRAQQATEETESEMDAGMETDEAEHLHNSEEEMGATSGSDWEETDDNNHVEEQKQGEDESRSDEDESSLSDWPTTDEYEQEELWNDVYGSAGDTDGDNASPSIFSKDRDLSHLKTSAFEVPGRRKPPEVPSKKERSAGLSPRLIRDDDSDDVEIESDLEGELQEEIERQMAAEPKFVRPSVTWGILLTRDLRLEARHNVLKYLEMEGINTAELTRIELPTKIDVMQTRLGFLRKIGLDNDAINKYPLILGCSVYKNMVPVLKYLKKLGFPKPWVPMLLKKYPMILHASIVIDILPVIYFMRGLDIDVLDLPRVILKYPDVLGFKTEGTMSTSVAYLVSMGVNLRHVGFMLTEYPELLGMRVASVLKPKVDYLMSLGIPQMIVAKTLARRPYILGYHLENRMQFNVNQLLDVGVRKEAIPGMVTQFPEIVGRVFPQFLKDHVDWFRKHLELDADGVARIIEKMPQVVLMPTAMANERIRFLTSERFSNAEVGCMVSQCPQILVSSIYDSLRPNLAFLIKEMKRSRADVLDFPAFFTYSLHTRIRPRFAALTEKDAHCSLEWLLNCSDLEFQKRLKAGYVGNEGSRPEFVMGGLLPGKLAMEGKRAMDGSEFLTSETCKVAAL